MHEMHASIEELEERLARLAEQGEQCRKLALTAKAAIGFGVLLIAVPILSAVFAGPTSWVAGAAAILSGIVLYGANGSTLEKLTAAIAEHEALRKELIDQVSPKEVGSGPIRGPNLAELPYRQGGSSTGRPPPTLH